MAKKINQSVVMALLTGFGLLMASSCKPSDDQILKTVTVVATAVAPKVFVHVQNGVVTLNGMIPDSLTKSDLDTAIRKMNGIVALHDYTTIPPLSDSVIAHDKDMIYSIDSGLKANNITGISVSVYNKVVTLNGSTTATAFKIIQQVVDTVHPRKVLNGLNVK
ncbi:MAG: BON domain-containing protein [Chitinophagaceae bacterium]|nr:MAG: BON domain-containing protein [Chitinophagaceae bacterium]